MRNNKVLATAITAAIVGSLSAGGASAGIGTVTYTGSNPEVATPPMYIATEVIGKRVALPGDDTCTGTLELSYTTESTIPVAGSAVVTIDLVDSSGKAVLGYPDLDSTSATLVANSVLSVESVNASPFDGQLVVSSGGLDQSTLGITIQMPAKKSLDSGSTLDFYFCVVDTAGVLHTGGETITANVSFGGSTSSKTIFTGKSGLEGKVTAGDDDGNVKVDIGGEAGSKKFTGSSINETTVILGEICLSDVVGTASVYQADFSTFNPFSDVEPNIGQIDFRIDNAPFNASIGHESPTVEGDSYTPEQIDKVMVFLDLNSDDEFSDSPYTDIAATTVETTSATFKVSEDDDGDGLENLRTAFQDNECVNVILRVPDDNGTAIKTYDTPPVGTLTVTFNPNGAQQTYTGNMNHIQKSGTFCACYNIPGPLSIENANIRVTNKSSIPDGTLFGTLKISGGGDKNGMTVFDYVSLGTLGANQTLYLNTKALEEKAVSAGWTDGWSRAILELETNLEEAEIMCLVRDNDVVGAPLMNMSVGASGDGCGR